MDFESHKPIYLQICDQISERILNGDLKSDDRILSAREFGASIGVNPNTIMRSYEHLQNNGIIYNKRGIGFFIAENAKEMVLEDKRRQFLEGDVPDFFKKMDLLGITPDKISEMYEHRSASGTQTQN